MSGFLIAALIVLGLLITLMLYRVWDGPTVFDRLFAVALISVNGVVVIVLLGFAFDRASLFLEIALSYALLAFLLPITLGRYFESVRRRRDELDPVFAEEDATDGDSEDQR